MDPKDKEEKEIAKGANLPEIPVTETPTTEVIETVETREKDDKDFVKKNKDFAKKDKDEEENGKFEKKKWKYKGEGFPETEEEDVDDGKEKNATKPVTAGFKEPDVKPKTQVLSKTLKKINALGFETTAVFAADACALSAISPTRVYSLLIDAIISLIHDLSQTRINVHPSVIINDVLSPTVCSVIATAGTKIVTNYVKVMSQVANAGIGGESRTVTLGFIAEAIASMSSQGSRRFNAEDVLDALKMAAVLRPFRGADATTDWTIPAQTLEQNIPHKLFTDSANFTEVLALSNALNNSGDIITAISGLTSHTDYRTLRSDIISTISELNTMSMMTINAKGLAASISKPSLTHLAATFSKRDFATETRTGCFSLSAFDLLLFLNNNNHCPLEIETFLTNIDTDTNRFVTRAQDSMLFSNGVDVSENFEHHPTGSLQYDFTTIKSALEPTELLDMEQLVYLCYQAHFENDPVLKNAATVATPKVVNETTYTFDWFTQLEKIYKFLSCFKQIYVDDVRSKVFSGNPLEALIERNRTTDPLSESITSSLLKTLSTVETANRMWATICMTFNNVIIDEGRDFTETNDWPLTVDKRRAVKMVLEQFTDYRVPNHYQRFSFNPLLVEPTMYVLRNPKNTNWHTNPGALVTIGQRADLIWTLRPEYVELIRVVGLFMLRTKLDRPATTADIVRLNTSFTLDALDGACLADTKQLTMTDLYDTYSFNDVANRQVISSIADVIVSLEQPNSSVMNNPSSFRLEVSKMFANCVSMDRLKEISIAIVEVSTMASDHLTKSLYITDDLEATVQRQLASAIGGVVSNLTTKIGRGGLLALSRTDVQCWEGTETRMLRAKIALVSTPIYRHTVSDIIRGASTGQGRNLFPINNSFLKHAHAVTDIFKVLLRMQHPDNQGFTREILTHLSLPFDLDPSAVFIQIATRHLFTPASYRTAHTLEDLIIPGDMIIFNDSIGLWYNQDILINEPIRSERDLLPLMVDVAPNVETDALLPGLFQNIVLKEVMAGSVTARPPSYAFHLSVSNQNRIIYRGVPMNNIIRK